MKYESLSLTQGFVVALAVLFLVIWRAPLHYEAQSLATYLPLHNVLESLSIVVAMLVFGVTWNAYSSERPGNIVLLACALLAVGLIDFAHMLSFKGMPDFFTPASPEKAINFWLAARLLAALALWTAAMRSARPLKSARTRYLLLASSLAITSFVYWIGINHEKELPHTFIEGVGLTPVKVAAEYLIITILVIPTVLFFIRARRDQFREADLLFAAAAISILSELSFILYSAVTDIFNLLGHVYKVIAYGFIYRAVFVASVREPFVRLLEANTKIQHDEEELRQSAERIADLYNKAPCGYHSLDENGAFIQINDTELDWLGYSREEVIGKLKFSDLLTSDSVRVFQGYFPHFKERGWINDVELEMVRKDGTVLSALLNDSAIRDSDGRYLMSRTTTYDITERKHAQFIIANSEKRFRSLIECGSDLVLLIDSRGTITYISPSIKQLAGYEVEEIMGRNFLEFVNPENAQAAVKDLDSLLRSPNDPHVAELRYRCKDGNWLTLETIARNMLAEPTVGGIVVNGRDISERKRAEQSLRKLNRSLLALSSCNQVLIYASDESQLLNDMCRLIVEVAGYHSAWVGFAQHDARKAIRPVAAAGCKDLCIEQADITGSDNEQGRGPAGAAIRTRMPQIIRDTRTNPAYEPWRANAVKLGYGSVLGLPLATHGSVLGALCIYSSESRGFDDEEVRLLRELADDLAFGIVTLRTRASHEKSVERLQRSMEGTILAMAATIEMRDLYTAGHQKRVAELAVAIAREMTLPEDDIQGLKLASMVHDLGKIQVPAEILAKPSELTDIEYRLIKAHPQAGYDILKEIDFSWPIAEIVYQHHERLDGSGYPRGLKAGAIMVGARILAIADSVEAMSSHRPYRPGLGTDKALAEIERGRGTAFDPVVVDACLRLFREDHFQLLVA